TRQLLHTRPFPVYATTASALAQELASRQRSRRRLFLQRGRHARRGDAKAVLRHDWRARLAVAETRQTLTLFPAIATVPASRPHHPALGRPTRAREDQATGLHDLLRRRRRRAGHLLPARRHRPPQAGHAGRRRHRLRRRREPAVRVRRHGHLSDAQGPSRLAALDGRVRRLRRRVRGQRDAFGVGGIV
ncbi:hypothetical protein LTR60_002818, partial [Cryomyces antarcticus]